MALLLASACYSYVPLEQRAPPPGEEVRARLNDGGVAWIGERTGTRMPTLEGRVVRATPDTLTLVVWRSDLPNAIRFDVARDTVRVPTRYVAAFEQRRLSYIKTGALAAGAAVGLYFLIDGFAGGGSGGPGDDGGPLLLRLPLPVP